jgi:hypothetical protein
MATQDSPDAVPRRRWWLLPFLIIASMLALGAAGLWIYRATEPSRLCKQARGHLAEGDYKNAAMALRRAVTIAPRNPEAVRLMSELTDKLGAPSAAAWHEQLVELNPDSSTDRTAWAASAIRSRRIDAAEEALAGAPESFRSTAEYEALRGMVAIGKGHWRDAEQAFGEARRRDPKRPSYQFNHALAQAQGPDAKARDAGIETLRELAKGGEFSPHAKRALTRVLTRQKHLPEALQYSVELANSKDAIFADHLSELDLVGWLKKEDFLAAMERARAVAVKSPQDLAALLTWSVQRGMARETRAWAEKLESGAVEKPEVIEAYAELVAATNDWPALAALTAKKLTWARGEAMRNAFATLAAEKQEKTDMATSFWQLATQAIGDSRETAMALAYFAHRAGWRARMSEVLWTASSSADPEWALRMLHRLCVDDGNTAGLLRVAKRLQAVKPEDDGARNNAIILALLLGEPAKSLVEDARALHAKAPENPVFASTYAYALHRSGNSAEGLAVVEKLSPTALQAPEIALYHAVLLSANGKEQPAREAAELARKGKMLPEEDGLIRALAAP